MRLSKITHIMRFRVAFGTQQITRRYARLSLQCMLDCTSWGHYLPIKAFSVCVICLTIRHSYCDDVSE